MVGARFAFCLLEEPSAGHPLSDCLGNVACNSAFSWTRCSTPQLHIVSKVPHSTATISS